MSADSPYDSRYELAKLAVCAPGAEVFLRLAVTDPQATFPLSSKFGATFADAPALLADAARAGLRPWGLTFHVGSQTTNPHAWSQGVARCADLIRSAVEARGIEVINIGGGFPAFYGSPIPQLDEIGDSLRATLASLPPGVRLVAEPGRALVAEAGTLKTTVIGRATRPDGDWLFLDVGAFNGLMECLQSGNSFRYPVSCALDATAGSRFFTLTGPTCDQQDTIMHRVSLPDTIVEGDVVYLANTGAYSAAYASAFNGFPGPEVRTR